MRKQIIWIIFIIISVQSVIAQDIKIGSSIRGVTNLITNETRIGKTDLSLWLENEIYQYEITSKLHLLVSANYYPFGVLLIDQPPYFLFDIDGDSILDTRTDRLFVPHWVVALNSKEKNNGQNIKNIFDMYYTAYQNNESIRTSELIINGAKEIVEAGKNLFYPNRDILYTFFLYDYLYTRREYQLCLKYLEFLDKTMISRMNGNTHVIIFIYLVETLYKLNDYQEAREINIMLLENFPECIPGKVYQVLLETEQVKKNSLRETLLKDHGNHWLVKEKLM